MNYKVANSAAASQNGRRSLHPCRGPMIPLSCVRVQCCMHACTGAPSRTLYGTDSAEWYDACPDLWILMVKAVVYAGRSGRRAAVETDDAPAAMFGHSTDEGGPLGAVRRAAQPNDSRGSLMNVAIPSAGHPPVTSTRSHRRPCARRPSFQRPFRPRRARRSRTPCPCAPSAPRTPSEACARAAWPF